MFCFVFYCFGRTILGSCPKARDELRLRLYKQPSSIMLSCGLHSDLIRTGLGCVLLSRLIQSGHDITVQLDCINQAILKLDVLLLEPRHSVCCWCNVNIVCVTKCIILYVELTD